MMIEYDKYVWILPTYREWLIVTYRGLHNIMRKKQDPYLHVMNNTSLLAEHAHKNHPYFAQICFYLVACPQSMVRPAVN
jgi:hypothetical protein